MDLSILNKEQKEAVICGLGPALVIAGAGSGKTRVLTYRIAFLIESKRFLPEELLAVTFTNKAAIELKTRIDALIKESGGGVLIGTPTAGTFHSVGVRILRKEIKLLGYDNNFAIIDSDDSLRIIKDILKSKEIDSRYSASFFKAEISRAKNNLQTPHELALGLDSDLEDLVRQVYTEYTNTLHAQNLVDFDDLIMLPVKIFELDTRVVEKYRKKFRYILVDEYQDTNKAQYRFLKLLANRGNIYVVGDDAQSIYGFRGSNMQNILDFEKDFPGAAVFKLEQNYRSTKHILAVAQEVIDINKEQKAKVLWTENETGDLVWVEETENEKAEALFVVKKIAQLANEEEEDFDPEVEEDENPKTFSILDHFLKQKPIDPALSLASIPRLKPTHISLSNFAVLFRTHAQSRALEEFFLQASIPYRIVGGVRFYERKEIKDVLAYLRLVQNFKEVISLKRVINVPARGLGEKSASVLFSYITENSAQLSDIDTLVTSLVEIRLGQKQKVQVTEFFSLIKSITESSPDIKLSELINLIVKRSGLDKYYRDKTEQGEERYENVRELISSAKRFDNLTWKDALPLFLEEVALLTDTEIVGIESEAVTLMTLHAAKGLEFDIVFFVGLEEGILPHSRSLMDPKELSEEVRLAYVGLTRARKKLFLLYAKSRLIFGDNKLSQPSRILKVLPEASVRFSGKSKRLIDNELIYESIDI